MIFRAVTPVSPGRYRTVALGGHGQASKAALQAESRVGQTYREVKGLAMENEHSIRLRVRLGPEEYAVARRLSQAWHVDVAEVVRRVASDGLRNVGVNERLESLEAGLRAELAELERRYHDLDDKIDYVSLLLDERTATRTNWAESFAQHKVRNHENIVTDGSGEAEALVEVPPEAPSKESRRYARRPGQGRPLAPVREILAGEHVEIDVSGQ